MKKSTLLGAVCALFVSQAAFAQANNDNVTYVEDPSQGYLFNKFSDNWFVTAEGGATIEFKHDDGKRPFQDRFSPAASIYVGKWFSPIIGGRLGVNWMQVKSLTQNDTFGRLDEPTYDGLYKNKFSEVGPVFDVMINLTNWWCGYRPGRIYNATLYAGGGGYWSFYKAYDNNGQPEGWKYAHERVITFRAGIINSFNISKHLQLALDLRYSAVDSHARYTSNKLNETSNVLQAYLAVTYLFNDTEWHHPVVPVCPPAEDCSGLRDELARANARINELERQLDACLKRPVGTTVTETVVNEAPLATIYFPINVSKLTYQDQRVLNAVAGVMKENPSQNYTVTGWADNYTGTNEINVRLRHERANSAASYLNRQGVPESQLNVTINNGSLSELGEKFQALDRAVTIEKTK